MADGWFNATLLKSLRAAAGWTQEDLSHHSGLSVRVIAKAEAGQAVRPKTAAALVKVFRKNGQQISLEDFTVNNESIARQFLANYAKYQADCVQHSLDIVSPAIEAVVAGDPATNPIAGVYKGLAEFDRLWRKFFAIFVRDGGTLVESPQIRSIENEVFVWGHENIRVPQAGPQPAGFVMLRLRFENGKMIYFEDHYEASGMMLQLEKWAHEFPQAEWLREVNHNALLTGEFRRPDSGPRATNE